MDRKKDKQIAGWIDGVRDSYIDSYITGFMTEAGGQVLVLVISKAS